MKLGKPDALFMHDLPAYEVEVQEEVLYGDQSIIFDQAENPNTQASWHHGPGVKA